MLLGDFIRLDVAWKTQLLGKTYKIGPVLNGIPAYKVLSLTQKWAKAIVCYKGIFYLLFLFQRFYCFPFTNVLSNTFLKRIVLKSSTDHNDKGKVTFLNGKCFGVLINILKGTALTSKTTRYYLIYLKGGYLILATIEQLKRITYISQKKVL